MIDHENNIIPYAPLGLIVLSNCEKLGKEVDCSILKLRNEPAENSYIIPCNEVRFSNGEGKVVLKDSARGKDIYIMSDIANYNCTYNMYGIENRKSPDDHFQDIKRVLSALGGKARRITIIMPLLYEARQHKKKLRESLDCSIALQELERLGVDDIITFDAHDPSIQNAIPLISFENLYPTYEIIKSLIQNEKTFTKEKQNLLIISPDTGAMDRAIYYSSMLGIDIGLFYKRRDYSKIVNGKNPIIQHEYMGRSVENQNILIVDDMICSGESIFDVVKELKRRKANKIFISSTFCLFTEGIDKFNEFYKSGLITKVYSTNLTYIPDEIRKAEWFKEVDMSGFISNVINKLNYDQSIAGLSDATEGIKEFLKNFVQK